MTFFYPPLRGLLIWARARWRHRHTCRHEAWTPLDGCPCGEA